jgi:hypothetical protein
MAPSRALDFFRGQRQSHGPKLSGPISRKIIRGKTWRDLLLAKLSQKYLDRLDRLDRALTVKHRAKFSLANGHYQARASCRRARAPDAREWFRSGTILFLLRGKINWSAETLPTRQSFSMPAPFNVTRDNPRATRELFANRVEDRSTTCRRVVSQFEFEVFV